MWIEVTILIVVIWLIYNGSISMFRAKGLPPGPRGLPFIGSFYYIAGDVAKNGQKLSRKYGNIFSLKLKGKDVVCVTGYDLIYEMMIDNPRKFSGRPSTLALKLSRGEKLEGIVTSSYNPQLVAHRKFFYTVLRNMGLNQHHFDKVITDELPYFINEFQTIAKPGTQVNPTSPLEWASLNILAYFVFGNRYSYGDTKFKQLLEYNNRCFHLVTKVNSPGFLLVSFVPYLYKLWLPKIAREIQECSRKIQDFLASEIEYHKTTIDPNNPRDFIDYYLLEIQKSNLFTESYLKKTILDFFQAGTETTLTTLKWALVYMVNNPEVQEKVQMEIDSVLESGKLPKYEDKLKMPYVEATILEVQRKATIAPFGIVRSTLEQANLGKYVLPKSTIVIPLYHSIHYSPKHWKNPNQFDPENFLDPDGKVGIRPAFMPFGGGLRICLGMNIAKQELFMMFVAILQHFQLKPPPGVKKLNEEYIPGLTLQPKPFKIVMTSR